MYTITNMALLTRSTSNCWSQVALKGFQYYFQNSTLCCANKNIYVKKNDLEKCQIYYFKKIYIFILFTCYWLRIFSYVYCRQRSGNLLFYIFLRGRHLTCRFINFNFCRKKIHLFCSPSSRRDIVTPVYGRYYYCFYFVNSQLIQYLLYSYSWIQFRNFLFNISEVGVDLKFGKNF